MKALLWGWVLVGLLPCMGLAASGVAHWQYRRWRDRRPRIGGGTTHDSYFRVGFGEYCVDLHPRSWTFVLLALGIVAVIVALVALLHVPIQEDRAA